MEAIGPYRILGEVARGGMGVVYRARGPQGQDVAVKLLLAHKAANVQARRRFTVEIQALARLHHDNVVPILGAGEHKGIPWLALEFVEGESLEARLGAGPLPVWEAIRVTEQLAQALSYVHSCGVLHRDLKPANVLLRGTQALLTDFGIARDAEASLTPLTATGAFLGTPGYWAPEQARGDRHEVGIHTDVYGLGAVLYACLTGRPPVEARTLQAHLDALTRKIPAPRTLCPQTPRWLSELCMRCLATDPARRPPSAEDVARTLNAGGANARGLPRPSALVVALAATVALLGGITLWIVFGGEGQQGTTGAQVATPQPHPTPATIEPEQGADALRQAQRLTQDGLVLLDGKVDRASLEGALEAFESALRLAPDHVPALAGRGRVNSMFGRPQAAIADFERALEIDPQSALAYAGRGAVYGNLGRQEDALVDLNRALALEPDNSLNYYNRGLTKCQLGDLQGAIADFTRSLRLRPGVAKVHTDRGVAYLKLRQLSEAQADLDRAVEFDPKYSPAYHNRALVQTIQGRHEAAVADLDQAIRLEPDYAPAYLERGKAKLELTRFEDALGDFEAALEREPREPSAYCMRAQAYAGMGQPLRALDDYGQALELDPRSVFAYSGRGMLLNSLGRTEEALADMGNAIRLDPESPELVLNRGTMLHKLGRLPEARTDFDRALSLSPDNAVLHVKRGLVFSDMGRHAEALRDVDRALQIGLPGPAQGKLERLRARIAARVGE